jgi:hypothetical protein
MTSVAGGRKTETRARAHGNRETLALLSRTGNEGKTGSLVMEIPGRVLCSADERKEKNET